MNATSLHTHKKKKKKGRRKRTSGTKSTERNDEGTNQLSHTRETRGVSHCGLAIYSSKKYLKAKEELWKLKYFTMQKYNLQKIL